MCALCESLLHFRTPDWVEVKQFGSNLEGFFSPGWVWYRLQLGTIVWIAPIYVIDYADNNILFIHGANIIKWIMFHPALRCLTGYPGWCIWLKHKLWSLHWSADWCQMHCHNLLWILKGHNLLNAEVNNYHVSKQEGRSKGRNYKLLLTKVGGLRGNKLLPSFWSEGAILECHIYPITCIAQVSLRPVQSEMGIKVTHIFAPPIARQYPAALRYPLDVRLVHMFPLHTGWSKVKHLCTMGTREALLKVIGVLYMLLYPGLVCIRGRVFWNSSSACYWDKVWVLHLIMKFLQPAQPVPPHPQQCPNFHMRISLADKWHYDAVTLILGGPLEVLNHWRRWPIPKVHYCALPSSRHPLLPRTFFEGFCLVFELAVPTTATRWCTTRCTTRCTASLGITRCTASLGITRCTTTVILI
jgi:hypothetical protein